jgi:hypothetical protein
MAAKLTQTMQDAIDSTPNEDGTRYARPATVKALVARGLAEQAGTSWFTLTDVGRASQTYECAGGCGERVVVVDQPTHNETRHKVVVRNVQVDIVDLDTDDAINLAADVARQAMIDAGMPIGPTTSVQLALFEGSYLVDLPAEWYGEHVNDATDFWAETGNVAVTISLP